MLQSTNKDAAECYQRAAEARRKARAAATSQLRADFLDMERHWLSLAESYEFADRLTRVADRVDNRH